MKKRWATVTAFLLCTTLLGGCASAFEKDYVSVTGHVELGETGGEEPAIIVSSYVNLKNQVLNLVTSGKETGIIRLSGNFDGDPSEAITQVCNEVATETPIGAYAVDYITPTDYKRIVSYYEVGFTITYRRTAEQIAGVRQLGLIDDLTGEIAAVLGEHQDYAAFMLSSGGIDEDAVREYIRVAYIENLADIVILPEVTVGIYPESGARKIVELELDYGFDKETLESMTEQLVLASSALAGDFAGEEFSPETAALLARRLTESTDYIPDGTDAGLGATAYGALILGGADSEGLSLAFNLLCGLTGGECQVVQGERGGMTCFWNILTFGEECYHLDPASLYAGGAGAALLCSDDVMRALGYEWDSVRYPECTGVA